MHRLYLHSLAPTKRRSLFRSNVRLADIPQAQSDFVARNRVGKIVLRRWT